MPEKTGTEVQTLCKGNEMFRVIDAEVEQYGMYFRLEEIKEDELDLMRLAARIKPLNVPCDEGRREDEKDADRAAAGGDPDDAGGMQRE